jgi:putative NADH-flavin reductase
VKKIIVFGASGGIGKKVVEQALHAGYPVTAIVRNPALFTISHQNLEIVKGDVLQAYSFENSIHKDDMIVSCLGVQKREPTKLYSTGITNISVAMQKAGARRILCISAAAVIVPPKMSFILQLFTKYILQRIFKYMYADLRLMEKIISGSDLDWTVIRPPRLINSKWTGKYRITINESLSNPSKISRADVADYILRHSDDLQSFKGIVELSY